MKFFKEKSQGFIMGLLVGLLAAGAFFILKLDDYISELNLYKKVSETFTAESRQTAPVISQQQPSSGRKKDREPEKQTVRTATSDTVKSSPEPAITADTLLTVADTTTLEDNSEEIVIRKDELLFTRTLEVINLSPVAKHSQKDSLLQKVSGVRDDKSAGKQFLNIEFWKSPLNYKGYKLSKYKLVLYGSPNADQLRLLRLDDVIYMKLSGSVYRLDHTAEFRALEKINDEAVLSRLK